MEADCLLVLKKDIKKMYEELLGHIRSAKNPCLQKLLGSCSMENMVFVKALRFRSAAKAVHYGFVGGLLEHTLSVTKLRDYYTGYYLMISRDLLLTAAIFHDVGKTKEPSRFLRSDYTDDGQFLGHIIIGTETAGESIRSVPGFLERLATELKCCILVHHRELECDPPEKSALLEALALNFADNADTKMKTIIEVPQPGGKNKGWLGYNRLLESNIGKTTE